MLKLLLPIPKQVTVAVSGGVDSMAVLDFLKRKHDVTVAFYHHGTETSEQAMSFVANYCNDNNLPVIFGMLQTPKPKELSQEEYWRDCRYDFLDKCGYVITAHHLDDCVETYVWSALHGKPKTINLVRGNVFRPFLTTPKSEFIDWCQRHNVPWLEDGSNNDTKYMRNYIRHNLMPHALTVNPGLKKTVEKLILKKQLGKV
jgi:tRNA(Ile)-lysidine synthase